MDKDVQDILLYEIRQTRKEVKSLENTVTTLKVKFGMIALFAGFIGSYIKPFILGHK